MGRSRSGTAYVCQEEHKANKTYRQFYRQLALPAVTISDLQRREAPLKYLQSLLISALKRLRSTVFSAQKPSNGASMLGGSPQTSPLAWPKRLCSPPEHSSRPEPFPASKSSQNRLPDGEPPRAGVGLKVRALVEHARRDRPGDWRVSIVGSRENDDWAN
jgi:hypothetical protein